jgi:glycerophosphoryl diester phosphodiesterase
MMTARQRRPAIAAATTVALVLVFLLSPDATGAQAANPLGHLHSPGQPAFVAGHRGDRDGAPENTLPAMRLAMDTGTDFLETDLQLTSDGVPVLMHDYTVDRTTNGSGPVWNMTLAQLERLDAGSWYSEAFTGTRVPTLAQLLDVARPSAQYLLLELKGSWNVAQVAGVRDMVYAARMDRRVVFAGFDIVSLANLLEVAPELPRVIITHEVVGDPAILAATCGASAIVTSQEFALAHPEVVGRIHAAGLGVMLYTLNSTRAWSEALSLGVDGIITDKPAGLERWIDKSAESTGAVTGSLATPST